MSHSCHLWNYSTWDLHYSLLLEFPHDLGAGYLYHHHKQPPSKTVAVSHHNSKYSFFFVKIRTVSQWLGVYLHLIGVNTTQSTYLLPQHATVDLSPERSSHRSRKATGSECFLLLSNMHTHTQNSLKNLHKLPTYDHQTVSWEVHRPSTRLPMYYLTSKQFESWEDDRLSVPSFHPNLLCTWGISTFNSTN